MGISRKSQIAYLIKYSILSRISDRFKKPLICGFKITNRCNLKCMHCPFWREKDRKEISYPEVLKILNRLYEEGVRIVIFEGGEPLLYKDEVSGKTIRDVVRYAKERFFYTGITTNGTLPLNKADPDITFISIDGLKKTHDRIRGKSFDKIISNLRNHNLSKKIIVNICISKLNYGEIPYLIKSLDEMVRGITVQFFYPYPDIEDLYLEDEKRKDVLDRIISLKKEGYSILDSFSCLEGLKKNTWKCRDFLVSSVDPDGGINYGCYLKKRVKDISCKYCGFAAHCEVSLAYSFNIQALKAAKSIFWDK